jgi:hypothetical protein
MNKTYHPYGKAYQLQHQLESGNHNKENHPTK